MAVLDRSELEASPLADLHAIADQLGLDGFRRLRKASLIDAILGEGGGEEPAPTAAASEPAPHEEADVRPEERPASRPRAGRGRTRAGARERPSRRAERPAGATAGGADAEEASARIA